MQVTRRTLAYGALAALALALTQHGMKYQLLGTNVGRTALVVLLAALTMQDKLLGLIAVGLIVFFGSWWQEGLEGVDKAVKKIGKEATETVTNDSTGETKDMKGPFSGGSGLLKKMMKGSTSTSTQDTTAKEGFDLIGAESSIKRGKQSNNVEVAPFMKESSMVEPFDGNMFRNGHAAF